MLLEKFKLGNNLQSLLGVNYYSFNQLIDNNGDNFYGSDITKIESRSLISSTLSEKITACFH